MKTKMIKTKAITLIAAFALAGVSVAQQSDEERQISEHFNRSVAQAIAAYPDFEKPESQLFKKINEMDNALAQANDPLFNSAEKPMILAQRAAKELGIIAVDPKPMQEAQSIPDMDGKVIPEMGGYKSVTIRKVEPDGLRIMHETGTTKIPIDELTAEARARYGLTMDGAAEYRNQLAARAAAHDTRQQETARTRQETPRPSAVETNPLVQWIGPGHQMAKDSYLANLGPRFQYSGNFKEGAMKGKTVEQATAKFEQIWATTPASVRQNWAKRAMMAGQTPEIQAAATNAKASEEQARRQRNEEEDRRLEDANRERRLKELEKAEQDRLNRERSPFRN